MAEPEIYDVVMIGAGPASLAAAVYTTREDLKTVLLEKGAIGGLAAVTDWIDNYPGFAKGISGLEFAEQLEAQAQRFGAVITLSEVTDIIDEGTVKRVKTAYDGDFLGKTVLIGTGTDYKKIGVPGESEYYGRGVHYCATCDGAFYRDKRLVVVGGGNSAVQEALFLTKFATHIDMLVRSTVKASEVLQHQLQKNPKITVHLQTTTTEIVGQDHKVVQVIGQQNGKQVQFTTDGVFVFVGLKPNSGFLKNNQHIQLDQYGFVTSDEQLRTGMPGVFVAGDIRSGATMQIATATGEGATAALRIREYLEKLDHAAAHEPMVNSQYVVSQEQ